MTSVIHVRFPHRTNRDGSFDSICKRCFQTIASRFSEAELVEAERGHSCDGPPLFCSFAAAGSGQLLSAHS